MSRLRILLLAADANPDSISLALEGYSHSAALAQRHDVTLVARSRNKEALSRVQTPFHAVEAISMAWVDRIQDWSIRWIFKNNFHSRALTPFLYPFSLAFEWHAWRQLRTRIVGGEFDVVLRILPANPVLPSLLPSRLRKLSIPFVIGPINGGLPWPRGFSQSDNQKSWIDNLRNLYRFLPFAQSTYHKATAIIAGSSQTYSEFCTYRDKLFFVAENGVDRSVCSDKVRRSVDAGKLELIFLGALVPYKACDLALRAAAPLLRRDLARFTVVGDGPERKRLEQLTKSLGIEGNVSFYGMLPHAEAMRCLRAADIMVYPSVREFGGAVVVEALASGVVPVVADFGGPGDIVHPGVGYKVPLTNENDVVEHMEEILAELSQNRDLLEQLRKQGMSYAQDRLTWDAKAQDTTRVLLWAAQRGPKPDFLPPNLLAAGLNSSGMDTTRGPKVERPAILTDTRNDCGSRLMKPSVSILIPAYNAEEWITDTLRCAVAQTWKPKEIIVVDDGSTDRTLAMARQFESDQLRVVTQKNQGAAATRNKALSLCRGDYIQYLDADDLIGPDKIAKQMEALGSSPDTRTLVSGPWGRFIYRYYRTNFVPTPLWCDLSPVEWLIRKMQFNTYMQTASWLVSRELAEAAGPWNTALLGDDDGEYFCRVLLASNGVRFVPEAKVYYRTSGSSSLSYIGHSDKKAAAQWRSMELHIRYIRSLENSPRVREACITYLQNWLFFFYPERPDLVGQAEKMAASLGGSLQPPKLSWKYLWIAALLGRQQAKRAQIILPRVKWSMIRRWDRALFQIEGRKFEESFLGI